MRYHHFPRSLQAKIEEYYRYMFDHRIGLENEQFLHELPNSLRAEVGVHMHRDVLGKVPFLQNADAKVLERLAFRLHPQLLRPQDTVFRKGDSGDRMYFIKRGTIEIYTSDKESPVALLQEGSFFGEAALLSSERRNATAKARGFCELVYLDQAALEETTRRYPDLAEAIRLIAQVPDVSASGGSVRP